MKLITCAGILFIPLIQVILCLTKEDNLRTSFLNRKKENQKLYNRIRLLEHYITNETIYLDNIPHILINKNYSKWTATNKIEEEFINLIKMNGVSYTYKRDFHWRTWREVVYPKGKKMICYECRIGTNDTRNCISCQGICYWVIQEKPPCPFELFSIAHENLLCAFDYKNFDDLSRPCPVIVNYNDITGICDNPIKTKWRITRVYKAGEFEQYKLPILCNRRDFCEILTLYQIFDDSIVFRIVNSSNHIIYSKIMRNNNTNYGCIEDCGTIDPETMAVKLIEKSLVVNLLDGHKNKRENYANPINENDNYDINGIKDENKHLVLEKGANIRHHNRNPMYFHNNRNSDHLISILQKQKKIYQKYKTTEYLIERPIQEFRIESTENTCKRIIENSLPNRNK